MTLSPDLQTYLQAGAFTRPQAELIERIIEYFAGLTDGAYAPIGASYLVLGASADLTNERITTAGTGINVVDGGAGSTWTISVTLAPFTTSDLAEGSNLYYTDERVDDRVAALVQDSATVTWTYDDGANTLTANVTASGVDHGGLSGLADDDHPQYTQHASAETITAEWTFSNFIDLAEIAAPSAPSANIARLYAVDRNGITELEFIDSTGIVHGVGEEIVKRVRNTTGSTLTKGSAVYIIGSTGNVPTVGLARADSASTLPCTGLVIEDILNNGFGRVMMLGLLENIDTSAFVEGDKLWISASTAGGFTTTAPTYPNFTQNIGVVTRSGVGNGSILVDAHDETTAAGATGRELLSTTTAADARTVLGFDEAAQDAVGAAFNATLVYDDAGNGMGRAAITGDVEIAAGSNTAAIGSGVIVDGDVNASAAIALSKLAAVTADRALVSNGSGFVSASSVTATELGYVSGVTSAVQTQINTKVTTNGALGTPSSGTLTNCTGLPISTGVSGLGANVATFLATPSSANLAAAVTDETGSGPLVFATSCVINPTSIGATTPGTGAFTSLSSTVGTVLATSSGNLGVGTGSPESAPKLHVQKGSAGTDPTWNVNDVALIEADSAENLVVQLFTANNKVSAIAFSDPDARSVGSIQYAHSIDTLSLRAGATTVMDIAAGSSAVTGTLSATDVVSTSGDTVRVQTAKTPASAAAAGTTGDICWDSSYLYICIATNTWRRIAHATW